MISHGNKSSTTGCRVECLIIIFFISIQLFLWILINTFLRLIRLVFLLLDILDGFNGLVGLILIKVGVGLKVMNILADEYIICKPGNNSLL